MIHATPGLSTGWLAGPSQVDPTLAISRMWESYVIVMERLVAGRGRPRSGSQRRHAIPVAWDSPGVHRRCDSIHAKAASGNAQNVDSGRARDSGGTADTLPDRPAIQTSYAARPVIWSSSISKPAGGSLAFARSTKSSAE